MEGQLRREIEEKESPPRRQFSSIRRTITSVTSTIPAGIRDHSCAPRCVGRTTAMTETQAKVFLIVLGLYLALGVLFAIPFLLKGAAAIDEDAVEGSWGFKVLVFPGAVALWPLLGKRWLGRASAHEERSPHRQAAGGAR